MADAPIDDDYKIQKVRAGLMELPSLSKKLTRKEIVNRLANTIEEARRKGYTLRDIASYIQNCGFDISYATLRNCLAQPRRKSKNQSEVSDKGGKKTATVAPVEPPLKHSPSSKTSDFPAPAPVKKTAPTAGIPEKPVFPPGATFIPLPGGRFLPAPDSEDL